MKPLDKILRNSLESTIKKARVIAEAAAKAALDQLGVGESKPFDYLSEDERNLRRRLRVHARQLGDERDDSGRQSLEILVEEVAYEHWHQMLFARFLAENNLLMYEGVSVSLEDCLELAEDSDVVKEFKLKGYNGLPSKWELAAKLATAMLPQIFRLDSPSFELLLPPENQQQLEKLLVDLDEEVFAASDSLGWVYQYWQAKRKDEVNAQEGSRGAREIPAVTQLFTEDYMVDFLIDNSLGAWWAGKKLSDADWQTASSEEELRQKAAIDGVPLKYLRFVQDEDGIWSPASGKFEKWPEKLKELKTLDPSCGSGHFLVAVLLTLVPMRMKLEGLTASDSVDAVLRDNINGLELEQRCVELAAFTLALTAWRYPEAGGYRKLPELNVACSGLSVSVAKEEWKQLALGKHNLRIALDWLYDEFKDAPVLGSLIDPSKSDANKVVSWQTLKPLLGEALNKEKTEEEKEIGVVAHGLAKTAQMLSSKYSWVITNVPYLARGKQCDVLKDYCEKHYNEAKSDLATVFLERCLELCAEHGTSSIVLPQNWLFLGSYKKFREKLLKSNVWHSIARLGPKAFQTPMWDFNVQLITISKGDNTTTGGLFEDDSIKSNCICGIDVSVPKTAAEKAELLITDEVKSVEQMNQLENPDSRVLLDNNTDNFPLFGEYVEVPQGIKTGDDNRFRTFFWEVHKGKLWRFYQSTPSAIDNHISGYSNQLKWENDGKNLARKQGEYAWGKKGVALSQMSEMPWALYWGEVQDSNINVVISKRENEFLASVAYSTSEELIYEVRKLDQKLSVTNATLKKVPFDLEKWQKVADEKYPHGLPKPYTNIPTQWIFHGHPCGSIIWDEQQKWTSTDVLRTDDSVLQIALARLLGYKWPAELDKEMELADEQRALVKDCSKLLSLADEDGIVCIPAIKGEASASERLLNMLVKAYDDQWSSTILEQLLETVACSGKNLEIWLRDKFFTQHCKMFGHRPFIWQIWDGLNDGFSALVNYHKLDYKNLETLIYTYLGDWITQQKRDIENGIDGAAEKLASAEQLKKKLILILKGEDPYDIFVRWKSLAKQPIGWNPDLNDGVRMNIRPFMSVPDVRKKGAGILRDKPNIKWGKDRGKDVTSAPWYKLGLEYGGKEGDRINDHHLNLDEKQKAREMEE